MTKRLIKISYDTSFSKGVITYVCDFNFTTAQLMCHPDKNIAMYFSSDGLHETVLEQTKKHFPKANIEVISVEA